MADFVETLVAKELAYELYGYVVFDYLRFFSNHFDSGEEERLYPYPAPVQYPILRGTMSSPLDFPLWAPCASCAGGRPSPWGNGNPTANAAYIRNHPLLRDAMM